MNGSVLHGFAECYCHPFAQHIHIYICVTMRCRVLQSVAAILLCSTYVYALQCVLSSKDERQIANYKLE